jgi:hypothetical protein
MAPVLRRDRAPRPGQTIREAERLGPCRNFRGGCRCERCKWHILKMKSHFKIMGGRSIKHARFPKDFEWRGYLLDWVLATGNDDNSSLNKAALLKPYHVLDYFNS